MKERLSCRVVCHSLYHECINSTIKMEKYMKNTKSKISLKIEGFLFIILSVILEKEVFLHLTVD